MSTAQTSSFTLAENSARDDDKAPHFSGNVIIDRIPYEAAAWLGTTRNGDPYVSLSLRPAGDRNGQKVSVSIWQKKNRTAEADPHFRVSQPILDVNYSLAATLRQDTGTELFSLILEMTPMGADELSPQAKMRHDEIARVFTGGPGPAPEPRREPSKFARAAQAPPGQTKMPPTLNEDGEPDDIPFRSTIRRDIKASRLSRRFH